MIKDMVEFPTIFVWKPRAPEERTSCVGHCAINVNVKLAKLRSLSVGGGDDVRTLSRTARLMSPVI